MCIYPCILGNLWFTENFSAHGVRGSSMFTDISEAKVNLAQNTSGDSTLIDLSNWKKNTQSYYSLWKNTFNVACGIVELQELVTLPVFINGASRQVVSWSKQSHKYQESENSNTESKIVLFTEERIEWVINKKMLFVWIISGFVSIYPDFIQYDVEIFPLYTQIHIHLTADCLSPFCSFTSWPVSPVHVCCPPSLMSISVWLPFDCLFSCIGQQMRAARWCSG